MFDKGGRVFGHGECREESGDSGISSHLDALETVWEDG
jgi:hypothetical protein